MSGLSTTYRDYIACLNRQDWAGLGRFVQDDVRYNGEKIGLSRYRDMLKGNFREIRDLHFDIQLLVCEPPCVASRLWFDCAPRGRFLGIEVNGRRVCFAENVFYRFSGGKIEEVWSVIDKTAIEAQL